MSAVVFYYRNSEFTTDSKFTIRSVFSTEEGPLGSPQASKWKPLKLYGMIRPTHARKHPSSERKRHINV